MDYRLAAHKLYWKMQGVVAPSLTSSQDRYEREVERHVKPGTRWLDVGCGHQIFPPWTADLEDRLVRTSEVVVGLDYSWPSLVKHRTIQRLVRGDMRTLPFRPGSFDLVTANMVVEHLDQPEIQFREVQRILRPGGVFLFHTPNLYGYTTLIARMLPDMIKVRLVELLEGRPEEDVFPTFYRANTRNRLGELAAQSGFTVEKIELSIEGAAFVLVPPLALLELVWLRFISSSALASLRTNIIAILRKPAQSAV